VAQGQAALQDKIQTHGIDVRVQFMPAFVVYGLVDELQCRSQCVSVIGGLQ
jgi:hypothetical protein